MTEKKKSIWIIDPKHSEIQFKVKHLAIAHVSGIFNSFTGEVQTENEDFADAKIRFSLDTNSVDTNNPERDGHLKSPAFLDTQNFPNILFEGFLRHEGENYTLQGELTIHGVRKNIALEVELTGAGVGRFGDIRTGFEINGKINRKDFGLSFNLLTDAGSLVVGEEIRLHADIELIKQST